MTQEEKQLLLKDLFARLMYGVKGFVDGLGAVSLIGYCDYIANDVAIEHGGDLTWMAVENFKPYLRPMSSMTDEEGKDLEHIFSEIDASCWVDTEYGCVNFAGGNDFIDTEIAEVYTDWLNKKMFDYRGLIPMGLALEANEGMYEK